MIPRLPAGHTLPLLLPIMPSPPDDLRDVVEQAKYEAAIDKAIRDYCSAAPLCLAMFNSIPFDFVARQKVQGNHLTWYLMEQLPVIPPREMERRRFGTRTASEILGEDVLHLTYTAHNMARFAEGQGYFGPPFTWDEEDRLRRRARIDAIFFHLYGLDRNAAQSVLSTFPVLRRSEQERFEGRYRSSDLVLAYMAALSAGNPDAKVVA